MDNVKRSVTYGTYPLLYDNEGAYQDITPTGQIHGNYTEIYKKFMRGERVSEKQKMDLFNQCITTTNPLLVDRRDRIYQLLLNKGKKYTNAEMIFLTQYTVYQSYLLTKYNPDGTLNPTYRNYTLPILRIRYDVPKDVGYSAVHKYPGIIEVNYENFMASCISRPLERKLDDVYLVDYLHVICHEMTHHRQMYEAMNGMMTKSAYDYLCRLLFRDSIYNEDVNYRYRQIEIEAELDGMRQAISIGRRYMPKKQRGAEVIALDSEQILLETAASIQYEQNKGLFYLTDEYDVREMVKLIRQHPDLVRQYTQLSTLFDANTGEVVSEEKLLALYKRNRGMPIKADLIFEQYLIYQYSNRDILLNTNLPAELLTQKTKFIINQVRKEYDYCKKVMQLVNSPRLLRVNREFMINQAPNVFNMRQQRIRLYKEYLEKVNVNQSIIKLSDEMISIYYNSVKKIIFDYPEFDINGNKYPEDNINDGGKKR